MRAGLAIKQATLAGVVHYGVFCSKPVISKGSCFGPFHGKLVNMSEMKTNDDNSFMWEVRPPCAASCGCEAPVRSLMWEVRTPPPCAASCGR